LNRLGRILRPPEYARPRARSQSAGPYLLKRGRGEPFLSFLSASVCRARETGKSFGLLIHHSVELPSGAERESWHLSWPPSR
jgi:hypothetical protein